MQLVDLANQGATIELDYYDCFRLARMLEEFSTSDSTLDTQFAEVYAGLFAAAGRAILLEADANIAHEPESLEVMRKKTRPEDVQLQAVRMEQAG